MSQLEYSDSDSDISDKKKNKKYKTGVKKGPGRPRKIPKKEPIPRKGLSNPTNDDSMMEFLYDLPLLIKKIIVFFKSLAAAQIQIIFRPSEIIFYAEDHYKKSKIRVKIDGSKLIIIIVKIHLTSAYHLKT